MQRPNNLASRLLLVCVCILVLSTAVAFRQYGVTPEKKDSKEAPDFSRFPVVDYEVPEPLESSVRAAREARSRKYKNKNMAPISEETYQIFTTTDWDVNLPALPVERSAAVVIGKIIEAEAQLTSDKTGVYSEFKVAIDIVVSNDRKNTINVGQTLTAERSGGRVRMPSGKIVISWVSNQNMPRVGGRYVLFLTHDFETPNDAGKDFYILTGYELQGGQVLLLDDTQPAHPITAYKGTTESIFLKDLFNKVAKASSPSK
jgi:hypothetical protein